MKKTFLAVAAIGLLAACVKPRIDNPSLPGQLIVKCDACKVSLKSNYETKTADLAKVGNLLYFKYDSLSTIKVTVSVKADQLVSVRLFDRANIQRFESPEAFVLAGDSIKCSYTFSK